jgi:hypothetical protein
LVSWTVSGLIRASFPFLLVIADNWLVIADIGLVIADIGLVIADLIRNPWIPDQVRDDNCRVRDDNFLFRDDKDNFC